MHGSRAAQYEGRRVLREERKWHQEWQEFFTGAQREAAVLTARAVRIGKHPAVPRCCDSFEVPWGLLVESPTAAFIWVLDLGQSPYRPGDTPRERGSVCHALWSTVFSQWAYNVAHELLSESKKAWNSLESADCGRLWWLPPALVRGMQDIGESALC